MNREGVVLLPSQLSREQVDAWSRELKRLLGGIKLLVNKKMMWTPGPPGFTYVFGTNQAWRVAWKPYHGESRDEMHLWSRTLPLTLDEALKAGALDLRNLEIQ